MRVIILRYEGYTNMEISEITEYTPNYIATLIKQFKEKGLEDYSTSNYKGGNNRLLSEDEILKQFEESMKKGQVLVSKDIKMALDKKIGKETPENYVYRLLKRKGYRKVMPRSKHPKKASNEEIESSKKLKIR